MKHPICMLALWLSISAPAQIPAQSLPEYTFFRSGKQAFTNKDLEPGKMLLFLFLDPDCEHCQRALATIDQHFEEYKKAAIYLVTLDDQGKISRFIEKYGAGLRNKKNITLLQDPLNEFLRKFNPRKYPAMFLFSPDKILLEYEDNEESMFRIAKQINASAP